MTVRATILVNEKDVDSELIEAHGTLIEEYFEGTAMARKYKDVIELKYLSREENDPEKVGVSLAKCAKKVIPGELIVQTEKGDPAFRYRLDLDDGGVGENGDLCLHDDTEKNDVEIPDQSKESLLYFLLNQCKARAKKRNISTYTLRLIYEDAEKNFGKIDKKGRGNPTSVLLERRHLERSTTKKSGFYLTKKGTDFLKENRDMQKHHIHLKMPEIKNAILSNLADSGGKITRKDWGLLLTSYDILNSKEKSRFTAALLNDGSLDYMQPKKEGVQTKGYVLGSGYLVNKSPQDSTKKSKASDEEPIAQKIEKVQRVKKGLFARLKDLLTQQIEVSAEIEGLEKKERDLRSEQAKRIRSQL